MLAPPTDLEIVKYGHPVLRQKGGKIGRITGDVRNLVHRMVDLLHKANGLGLAANQVGIARQVAVVEIDGKLTPLIDPEIVSMKGAEAGEEGCLSLPRLFGIVTRPTQVTISARDLSGKRIKIRAEGLMARALMHEIDHLNGRLFIDQVDNASLHWSIRASEEGDVVVQPTTLEDALKVFTTAPRAGK
jgi:peptide deformylase